MSQPTGGDPLATCNPTYDSLTSDDDERGRFRHDEIRGQPMNDVDGASFASRRHPHPRPRRPRRGRIVVDDG